MAQVMAAVSSIAKKRSSGVSYEFRGIDDVMNALHGPLSEAGLFLSPRVLDDWQLNMIPGSPDNKGNPRVQAQALFRVAVDVWHSSGEMVTLGPGLAQSHDYGDKAVYQAQQNAIKYLLLEAFAIPTSEQDMDARQADDVPAAKPDYAIWLADQVPIFKAWDEDERKLSYAAAVKRLGLEGMSSMDDAHRIFAEMEVIYSERPLQADALPLEEK